MSWVTIRDGVKTRLDTISGLSARDTAPSTLPDRDTATVLPGDPLILPSGHHNKVDINFVVLVRCNRGKLKDSQDALDVYLWPAGSGSIVAALEGGSTLSSTVDDVRFTGVTAYGGIEGTEAVQAQVNFTAKVTAA